MSKPVDFSLFKCRCSAINKILSNSRDNPVITDKQAVLLSELEKKDNLTDKQKEEVARLVVLRENASKIILSDTCIDYLMEVYAWETEGMIPVNKESMDLMQLKKGKMAEKQSIELISIVEDTWYEKNDIRVSNEYLSGEPDIFSGNSIMDAESITDAKSIWDYPGYLQKLHKPLESGYPEQVKGYCDITGAKKGQIARVLVDTPEEIIQDMKWKIAKKFGAVTTESPDFLEEWAKWERSMKFSHIPIAQRVYRIPVPLFTTQEQQKVYDRVKICRDWLCKFYETRQSLN